jgi:3'-5' exoribonuclease
MKRVFVKDLHDGDEVDEAFAVREAASRQSRSGSLYISGTLADQTGIVPFKQWDAAPETINLYQAGPCVRVRGRVEAYPAGSGKLQLVVRQVRMLNPGEYDPVDFEPTTSADPAALERELDELVAAVKTPALHRVLEAVFGDPALRAAFLVSPAATDYHHPFRCGLLEHSVSMARAALRLVEGNARLDRDLLLAGCLLHDLGKIEELRGGLQREYTPAGRLLGHLALGALLLDRKIRELGDVPEETRRLLLHLILSHHGTHEFGAPVLPAIPEAFALYHLDNLDAKVEGARWLIERDTGTDENFTEYSKMLGVRLYKRPEAKAGGAADEKSSGASKKPGGAAPAGGGGRRKA